MQLKKAGLEMTEEVGKEELNGRPVYVLSFTGATGSGAYSGWAELESLAPGTVGVGQVTFEGTLNNP